MKSPDISNFKLQLHLIPETCFGFNLRNHLGSQWSKLSKKIRQERGYRCDICNIRLPKKSMHLHEVWDFTDGIQKLIGFECICYVCHGVHHWGLSQIHGKNMEHLLKHACKVNDCYDWEFVNHIRDSAEIWKERSSHKWELDLSYMDTMK